MDNGILNSEETVNAVGFVKSIVDYLAQYVVQKPVKFPSRKNLVYYRLPSNMYGIDLIDYVMERWNLTYDAAQWVVEAHRRSVMIQPTINSTVIIGDPHGVPAMNFKTTYHGNYQCHVNPVTLEAGRGINDAVYLYETVGDEKVYVLRAEVINIRSGLTEHYLFYGPFLETLVDLVGHVISDSNQLNDIRQSIRRYRNSDGSKFNHLAQSPKLPRFKESSYVKR